MILRLDRVADRRFGVGDVRPGGRQSVTGGAAVVDRDHRVERAVGDRHREPVEAGEIELEPVHGRHESRQRHQSRRPLLGRPAEAEGVAHHRSLREPAEHERLLEAVEQLGEPREARPERLRLGRGDPAEPVPVPASRRQRQRAAGGEAPQAALRVERVEQGIEVVLVGAAPMEEDERSGRLALGRPLEGVDGHPRGLGSGVSRGSICSRRCSKSGGRESRSPRCSASSSVAKPGPSVASSNRIPFGSRK